MGFTIQGYKWILDTLISANFRFIKYKPNLLSDNNAIILLRHDIDLDLDSALEIAKVDHSRGIESTFYIMPSNPFYDIYAAPTINSVRNIYELGHDVALHIDLSNSNQPLKLIKHSLIRLKELFPFIREDIFSIHSPGLSNMSKVFKPGIINVSSVKLFDQSVTYISDSTGKWNENGHVLSSIAFKFRKPIQLLIHPIWWIIEGKTPLEKLRKLSRENSWSLYSLQEYLPKLFDQPRTLSTKVPRGHASQKVQSEVDQVRIVPSSTF